VQGISRCPNARARRRDLLPAFGFSCCYYELKDRLAAGTPLSREDSRLSASYEQRFYQHSRWVNSRDRASDRSIPDEHRSERPILLAVDQKLGERPRIT